MKAVSLQKKRKNIDLPVETLQKLSIMAASQGESLKAFIEKILIKKADSVSVEVSTNPSPSGELGLMIPKTWHPSCVALRMPNRENRKPIQWMKLEICWGMKYKLVLTEEAERQLLLWKKSG